ncbi:unnamed protein product [Rotaria socialis]
MTFSSTTNTSFLIIADSYGKCLSPTVSTPYYSITTYSISGLRWFNPYDDNLNLFALIQTEKFSSLFSTTSNILFLVGINSVRNLPATNVIQQLDQFLHLLFSNYTHLTAGQIIITTCPPCLKISNRYSNISLLQNNIDYYNHLLFSLSSKYKVSVLDLKISFEWLGRDGLHIDYVYREEFSNIILNYINNTNMHQQTSSNVSTRSRYSISKPIHFCGIALYHVNSQVKLENYILRCHPYDRESQNANQIRLFVESKLSEYKLKIDNQTFIVTDNEN